MSTLTYQNRQLSVDEKIKDSYDNINLNSDELLVDLSSIEAQINSLVIGGSNATIGAYPIVASGLNAYTGTFSGLSYFVGLFVNLKNVSSNTGVSTLNINGLGAKNIKIRKADGTLRDVSIGELHDEVQIIYDGTQFVLTSTRSIIEEGQNANGYYARYEDGTQICRKTDLSIPYVNASRLTGGWTFPATFIDTSSISLVSSISQSGGIEGLTGGFSNAGPFVARVITINSADARMYNAGVGFGVTDEILANLIAIGKWR